jgi:hypothetical protein
VTYTPDGRQITFGLNGINWIASGASSGDTQVLLANDPYPEPNRPGPARFVQPVAWSPDGQRLLLSYYYYASDDFGRRVLDVTTGAESPACRSGIWSRDSQALFCTEMTYAAELGTRLEIGRVDVATGEQSLVVQGVPAGQLTAAKPYRLFRAVYQTADGSFLAFGDQWTTPPPLAGPVSFYDVQRFTMQRVSADGQTITPLRMDRYRLAGSMLWATDGSGALISDATTEEAGRQAAPLLWLPSDGSPAVELFAVGRQMQWRTRPVADKLTPLPTTVVTSPTQGMILEILNVRSGPGTTFPVLGQLAVGATVAVTGRTDEAGERWWQIAYAAGNSDRAWINGDPTLVQVAQSSEVSGVEPLPPAPTPANPAATPTAMPNTQADTPAIVSFTVAPTTTQKLGDPMTLTWATTGERAALCRLVITQLNCEAVPVAGQRIVIADQNLLGMSAFVLQAFAGEQRIQKVVDVSPQCQNRFAWFFANPPMACPTDAADVSPAAYQRFEHGLMLWVDHGPDQADDEFYIFFDENPRTYGTLAAPFRQKAGASPANRTGETPPAGLFEPVSGFGMLWRDEFETDPFYFHDLRTRLGWALAPEAIYAFARQCTTHLTCYLRLPGDQIVRTHPDSTVGVRQLWEEWPGP